MRKERKGKERKEKKRNICANGEKNTIRGTRIHTFCCPDKYVKPMCRKTNEVSYSVLLVSHCVHFHIRIHHLYESNLSRKIYVMLGAKLGF